MRSGLNAQRVVLRSGRGPDDRARQILRSAVGERAGGRVLLAARYANGGVGRGDGEGDERGRCGTDGKRARGDKTAEGQASIAINAEKLRRPLARLNLHLADHPYLVADRFTVADINTAECLRYAQGHASLLAEFPAVKTWLETCQSRPAFQAMWAARLAEPA